MHIYCVNELRNSVVNYQSHMGSPSLFCSLLPIFRSSTTCTSCSQLTFRMTTHPLRVHFWITNPHWLWLPPTLVSDLYHCPPRSEQFSELKVTRLSELGEWTRKPLYLSIFQDWMVTSFSHSDFLLAFIAALIPVVDLLIYPPPLIIYCLNIEFIMCDWVLVIRCDSWRCWRFGVQQLVNYAYAGKLQTFIDDVVLTLVMIALFRVLGIGASFGLISSHETMAELSGRKKDKSTHLWRWRSLRERKEHGKKHVQDELIISTHFRNGRRDFGFDSFQSKKKLNYVVL